jgi:uncharacterized phage protein (TIGR02218 family)
VTKTVGAALRSHMAQETTTLATLLKITRADATVFAFTSHDKALVYDSVTYTPVNAFTPSTVQTTAGMNVDNLDVLAVIDSDEVSESDLRAGLFDYATIEIFLVNWSDLTQGRMMLRKGTLGEISVHRSGIWQGELRGMMQPLQQTIGRLYMMRCDADLGDARCGINLAAITQSGTVVSASDRANFIPTALTDATFAGGLVTWTSGLNSGLAMEVKNWSASPTALELFLPMPFNIVAGDGFTISPGCDKNLSTCRDTFNNVVNFRGFPFIPGRDKVLKYPDNPD